MYAPVTLFSTNRQTECPSPPTPAKNAFAFAKRHTQPDRIFGPCMLDRIRIRLTALATEEQKNTPADTYLIRLNYLVQI